MHHPPLFAERAKNQGSLNQCCHSVLKKNPIFYLEKNPENNKKLQTYKMFKSLHPT